MGVCGSLPVPSGARTPRGCRAQGSVVQRSGRGWGMGPADSPPAVCPCRAASAQLPAPAPAGLEPEPRPAVPARKAGAAGARGPEPVGSERRRPEERARPGQRPQDRRECDGRAPRPEHPRSVFWAAGRAGCNPARPTGLIEVGERWSWRGWIAGGALTVAGTSSRCQLFFLQLIESVFSKLPLAVSLCRKVMAI